MKWYYHLITLPICFFAGYFFTSALDKIRKKRLMNKQMKSFDRKLTDAVRRKEESTLN